MEHSRLLVLIGAILIGACLSAPEDTVVPEGDTFSEASSYPPKSFQLVEAKTGSSTSKAVVYTVHRDPVSPQDARDRCPSGQTLATVRSATEEALLEKTVKATTKSNGANWNALWLGAKW